jgi:hypothetical protein
MQPQQQPSTKEAQVRLRSALVPTRSVLFYTLTATIPLIVIAIVLLFTRITGRALLTLVVIGAVVGFVGLGRLLYEIVLDVAGFPDYKLPVWSVFYLIAYAISAFGFLFYALDRASPGKYFSGVSRAEKMGYIDALYLSLCNYIGSTPDASITMPSRVARFLSVGQSTIALFINLVIITKFVNTF